MTNEAIPYALGINVSKAKLEAALLTPAGQLHAKSASNAPSGFEALLRWANSVKLLSNRWDGSSIRGIL